MNRNKKIILYIIILIQFFTLSLYSQNSELTTVFLVRHCEKADDSSDDPDLSEDGMERAEELAHVFTNSALDVIYATQYKRTQQTVKPTADKLGLDIKIIESLIGEDLKSFMDKILEEYVEKKVLIASHSNIIPVLIKIIRNEDFTITKMEYIDDSVYDDLFVISFSNRNAVQVINLKYGKKTLQSNIN